MNGCCNMPNKKEPIMSSTLNYKNVFMERFNFTFKRKSRLLWLSAFLAVFAGFLMSSSHREAPLIANDPLADNTDLYAFRSPDNPNNIILIADYIPAEL